MKQLTHIFAASLVLGLAATSAWAQTAIPKSNAEAIRQNFRAEDSSHNMIENRDADTRATNNEWRYVRHNGRWWYWTPNSTWMHHDGRNWNPHQAATAGNTDTTRTRVTRGGTATSNRAANSTLNPAKDPAPVGTRTRTRATFNGPNQNQVDLDPLGLTPQEHNQTIEDAAVGGQSQLRPLVGGKPGRAGSINGGTGTGSTGVGAAGPAN